MITIGVRLARAMLKIVAKTAEAVMTDVRKEEEGRASKWMLGQRPFLTGGDSGQLSFSTLSVRDIVVVSLTHSEFGASSSSIKQRMEI